MDLWCPYVPWYLASNLSSFRSFDRTSGGKSVVVEGLGKITAFSLTTSPSSAPVVSAVAPFSPITSGFISGIAGVPLREGSSESSSITKVPSNTEGSGPLAPSSTSFGRVCDLFEGDSFLSAADLLAVALLAGDAAAAFAFACSSAILESITPFIRCQVLEIGREMRNRGVLEVPGT
jgi:hypothetical protein